MKDIDDLIDGDENVEIKTGNVIFTISHKEDYSPKEIKGKRMFIDKKVKLVKYGDEKKCRGCKELGHLFKNCPRMESGVQSQENKQVDDEDLAVNQNKNNQQEYTTRKTLENIAIEEDEMVQI